ncbi:transmembrane protein 72-like [Watersipora subatra]|uniref:transmembrane protein 72-like n=1 Tax=Watersipora subatra TaxID=2589382 RepID=UPI00355C11E9
MALSPQHRQFCSEYFVWFCRLWGIATALVLWGIGIEVAFDKELVGYYIIGVAAVMSGFETMFLVHYVVKECQTDCNKSCLSCWSCFLTFDDWKKSLLYIALSVFCLIRNFLLEGEAWMSMIAGIMLLLAAFFYMIKSFTNSRIYLPAEPQDHDPSTNSYNRVDRSGEDLGSAGSITNDLPPNLGDNVSIRSGAALLGNDQSMAEQSGIMEA